jgi:hypothetical protein
MAVARPIAALEKFKQAKRQEKYENYFNHAEQI